MPEDFDQESATFEREGVIAANLPDRLRRWAKARDRRLAQGGNAGVTGTELLREAAEEIERLRGYVATVAAGVSREDLLEIERALNVGE